MMVKIIAFEGMPGAGKTTIIDSLLKDNLLSESTMIPEPYIGKLDGLSGSKSYLDLEIDKLNKINDLKNHYNNILLDRTFLSTLAYSYAKSKINRGTDEYLDLLNYFEYLDNKYNLLRPTHLFYLDVAIPESLKRREKFSEIDEFNNWFDSEFLKHFSEFYSQNINKFNMPKYILIDTNNLSKDAVTEKVVSILKK
jgi:thymidylate kinase